MVIKQLFILVVLCVLQVSFGMQSNLDDALRKAVCYGTVDQVEELLENGAHINAKDGHEMTPLMLAVDCTREDMCRLLIQRGADLDAQDKYGLTALFLACEHPICDMTNICQMLIAAGADLNKAGIVGYTPLMMAASKVKIMRHLLAAGADCNAVNRDGDTALVFAAKEAKFVSCELLLQYGAETTMRDSSGRLAVDQVRESLRWIQGRDRSDHEKIIALLSDPAKIRAVILREDNPCLEMKPWRKTDKNIFNALMGREMGGK